MKKYKPSKMVNWFEPGMLFQTGLRSCTGTLPVCHLIEKPTLIE